MAAVRKRVDLGDILSDDDTAAAASEGTQDAGQTTTRSPRKKSTAKSTKKTATSPQKRAQRSGAGDNATSGDIQVLAIDTATAKRPSLYLHPDDWKALQLAKIEDGADLNARIRAMIAVWRGNKRFAQQVDRLAKTAPRGGY